MLGISRKTFWQGSDANPESIASEPCCPTPTAVVFFLNKKSWEFWSDKKKKNDPTE